MDQTAITAQASAAIQHLTSQLESLRQQQSALLDSLTLTTNTISSLPAYHQVAPTLNQIPIYEAKLARLKATMNAQANTVVNLRKRAEATRTLRAKNVDRIKERRLKEREEDRTVLRARVVGEERVPTPVSSVQSPEATGSERISTPPPTMAVKTVKKKKKVRQAMMD